MHPVVKCIRLTFANGIGEYRISRSDAATDDQALEECQSRYKSPDQKPTYEPGGSHDGTEEDQQRSPLFQQIRFWQSDPGEEYLNSDNDPSNLERKIVGIF